MGNGIAHLFAMNNFSVTLNDVSIEILNKAISTISSNLDRQIKKGEITESQKKLYFQIFLFLQNLKILFQMLIW